ncbi:FRG domain-containing protein [bacterium]|nr:MAG: FRG domain-containing protein [bacterium]
MTTLIHHTAKDLPDYINLVARLNREEDGDAWFRGHSSASHRLIPSVLREVTPLTDSRGNPLRGDEILRADGFSVTGPNPERMLDEFKRRAVPFLSRQPKNEFEWLFLMQHHGVPTRLLDWTTNALVALYFALEYLGAESTTCAEDAASEFLKGDDLRGDGMAIFCINPKKINNELHGIQYPVDVAADAETWAPFVRPTNASELNTYAPLCILAPHISPRIRAQSGTFTLHGSNIWSLDYYSVLQPLIHKIFIPYSSAIAIKDDISSLGFTPSFIYPDLDGLSQEIRNQEFRRHAMDRKQYLAKLQRGV